MKLWREPKYARDENPISSNDFEDKQMWQQHNLFVLRSFNENKSIELTKGELKSMSTIIIFTLPSPPLSVGIFCFINSLCSVAS